MPDFTEDTVVAIQQSVDGGNLSRCQQSSNHGGGDALALRFAHVRDNLDSKTPVTTLRTQGLDSPRPAMPVSEIFPHQQDTCGEALRKNSFLKVFVAQCGKLFIKRKHDNS